MPLSWNEFRDRAIEFARNHADDRSEAAEKQTFWNEFFKVCVCGLAKSKNML